MKKPKLLLSDIEFNPDGITCKKITELSDNQLDQLEKDLTDILTVTIEYCNIEEFKYLTSSYWSRSCYLITKAEKHAVYKLLLKYIKC